MRTFSDEEDSFALPERLLPARSLLLPLSRRRPLRIQALVLCACALLALGIAAQRRADAASASCAGRLGLELLVPFAVLLRLPRALLGLALLLRDLLAGESCSGSIRPASEASYGLVRISITTTRDGDGGYVNGPEASLPLRLGAFGMDGNAVFRQCPLHRSASE